jgi:superfamily II DNA or RNA helicase
LVLAADRADFLQGDETDSPRRLVADWQEVDAVPSSASPQKQAGWKKLLAGLPPEQEPLHSDALPECEYWYALCPSAHYISGFELRAEIRFRERKKNGEWGKLKSGRIPRRLMAKLPATDREAMSMLGGGAADLYDFSNQDSIATSFRIAGSMAAPVLQKLCQTGRCAIDPEGQRDVDGLIPLSWDEGERWTFGLRLETSGEKLKLTGAFQRGAERLEPAQVGFATADGLLFANGLVSRFEGRGAFPWWSLLKRTGPIEVPASEGDELVEHMLQHTALPPVDWPASLAVVEHIVQPRAVLRITESKDRTRGSRDELCCYVSFNYDGAIFRDTDQKSTEFVKDRRIVVRRDGSAEAARLAEIARYGLRPDRACYDGGVAHYHLPPRKLGMAVSQSIADGWHVELEGRAFRKPVQFGAAISSGVDWFELQANIDFGAAKAALPDLLRALRQKSNVVELSDGSFGILPEELIQQLGPLLGVGTIEGDRVRYSRAQASLLDALLAARPQVSVDELFREARDRLRNFDRILPSPQPGGFNGQLRHYQEEGLAWMLFLRELGFGGCLADDMGLGKTAQVLALLEIRRQSRESGEAVGPSLAVVPRSVVFNWKREAERFTPQLRVRDYSGTDRKRGAADFSDCDLVLTTYGTLRRDIAILQSVQFDYAILDEAQAIKNATSDSAKTACLVRSRNRLALSGTPIENHVGELFSLFEFLNPGMLGSMAALSLGGASLRNPDEATRSMLAMAVRPFLLRRTKDQVAPELPARTEQTIYCELESEQRKQYDELRDHYRAVLLGRIATQGLAKSQMHILEALLRLRQAACHPGLLDATCADAPSAKTEALMAQIAEVMSEGHKALVFSQFTSLLAIVRKQVEAAGIRYEYLDGKTRDRQQRVDSFQNDPECKLFLISLKAGGLGLNLTAAEYVFLLDPWWNPAVEAQAVDRAHRIGQSKRVFAYRLIARDTVEEKVVELQSRKRDLADSIIRADASLVRDLKREDLEFLLS